jgi:hypothetical protein
VRNQEGREVVVCYEKNGFVKKAAINRKSPYHAQAQEAKFINDVNVNQVREETALK